MQILDLGTLDAPLLLFGGPYSNLQATRALRAWADRAGILPQQVICTGDVVAYCADAAATVSEIRDWGIPVVAGNCEKQLASGAMDCGCGFEEGTACDLLSGAWFAHASAQIGAADRQWMAGCPDIVLLSLGVKRYAAIHGGVTDISRFLWPDSPDADFAEEIEVVQAHVGAIDGVIAGHCGMGFERDINGLHWINAGAIGMPANGGRPETRFAVLDASGAVRFETLRYDYQTAAQAMRAVGLTQGYDRALESGWWPSEEVLPVSLRRQSCASG